MAIKYYDYNKLKKRLVVKEEIKTKLRKHNEIESEKLKKGLLYHKRILTPLEVYPSWGGLVLVCGHHRWNMLPEIIRECPNFDLNIPVVFIEAEDVQERIIDEQLGRRNLSNSEIAQYINLLITEDGLSANKAYEVVAETIGKSPSTIKRIHKPKQAKANQVRQKVRDISKKSSNGEVRKDFLVFDERMRDTDDISVKMTEKTPESIGTSLKGIKREKVKEKTEEEICEELLLELHTLAVKLSYRPSLQEYSTSLYDIYDQIEIKLK